MGLKMECASNDIVNYDSLLFLPSTSVKLYSFEENCSWNSESLLFDPGTQKSLIKNVVKPVKTIEIPNPHDMKYWIVAAVVLLFIRKIVDSKLFLPLGRLLAVKDHIPLDKIPCRNSSALRSLESAYISRKKGHSDLKFYELSKETELSSREIERWMRKRKALDKPSALVKFSESGWRFVTYVFSTTFGLLALWDKPWFWDWQQAVIGYPNHELSREVYWYHCYAAGLYISFLLTQFMDVKRKDFWEMLLHHIVTLGLLLASFTLNLTRAAMLGFVIHDCADIFIESAKMANYAKKDNLATGIFIVFTLIWIVTRLVVFPQIYLYEGVWKLGFNHIPDHIVYPVLGMLLMIFCLHLFWTYFILKIVVRTLTSGITERDSRSSTEESSESSSSDSNATEEIATSKYANSLLNKRLSLQYENIANTIITKKRLIMKRISVEIM